MLRSVVCCWGWAAAGWVAGLLNEKIEACGWACAGWVDPKMLVFAVAAVFWPKGLVVAAVVAAAVVPTI